jgi:putative N6-adenine-specific DNA methylase
MKIVAKTLYGFEEVLAEELRELGVKDLVVGNRVVEFQGDKKMLYKCNLWLRTAISLLVPIKSFSFNNEYDL